MKRILIIDDDFDTSNTLRIYFTGQGFEVTVATSGKDGLALASSWLPQLILLEIRLPDMDGYAVLRELHSNPRTSHIPIIFLTHKGERSDKIAGVESGADDYVTKPFNIEELKLRVTNAIRRQERESGLDPLTGLPTGRLIEDQLRRIMRSSNWALLDCRINDFERFKSVYGFKAGEAVVRFTAMLIGEVIDEVGTPNDFIGQPGGDNFVVITDIAHAAQVRDRIKARFKEEVLAHYNTVDREQGYMLAKADDGNEIKVPLMTMAIGLVSADDRRS